MRNCIYLIQGRAKLIQNFLTLNQRQNSTALFLTFDEEIEGAIYYPASSWSEGRNYLLEKALEQEYAYQYYIFLDDDVRFIRGEFSTFEEALIKYNPAVALPVFSPKTINSVLGIGLSFHHKYFINLSPYQICKYGDAQFIAIHRDLILDRLIVPLQTDLDTISWNAVSSTQQLLMFNLYSDFVLQFNEIVVTNEIHGEYPKKFAKDIQREWFAQQFCNPITDPRKYAINLLSIEGVRRLGKLGKRGILKAIIHFVDTIFRTLRYQQRENYRIPNEELSMILRQESILFKQ